MHNTQTPCNFCVNYCQCTTTGNTFSKFCQYQFCAEFQSLGQNVDVIIDGSLEIPYFFNSGLCLFGCFIHANSGPDISTKNGPWREASKPVYHVETLSLFISTLTLYGYASCKFPATYGILLNSHKFMGNYRILAHIR